MPVSNGISGAGLYAIAAKNAAIVVDVVDLGVALTAAEALFGRVFGCFNIDAVGRACCGTKKARNAFLETILIALQYVRAAEALLELGRTVRI